MDTLFSHPHTIQTLLVCFLYCISFSFFFALMLKPVKTTSSSSVKPPIINNLAFLKIFLAYCIVIHHSFLQIDLPNNGHVCVEFFFIISGFMLSYNYQASRTIGSFALNKILSFVPYIFLANLGCLLLEQNFNIEKFLSGIFFYATTNLYQNYTYYHPAWFLIVLFWTTLFYFSLMKNLPNNLCYFLIAIIAFVFLPLRADIFPIPATNLHFPFLTNGMIRGLAYVGIGCLLAKIYKPQPTELCVSSRLFYTLLEGSLFLYIIFMLFLPKYFASLNIMLICFIALFELLLLKRGYISRYFDNPFCFNLSKFALPIYMTHDIFIPQIFRLNCLEACSTTSKVLIAVIFSTFFGVLTYYLFNFAKYMHIRLFK